MVETMQDVSKVGISRALKTQEGQVISSVTALVSQARQMLARLEATVAREEVPSIQTLWRVHALWTSMSAQVSANLVKALGAGLQASNLKLQQKHLDEMEVLISTLAAAKSDEKKSKKKRKAPKPKRRKS